MSCATAGGFNIPEPAFGMHCLSLETSHGSGWLSPAALGMPQDWALQLKSAGAVQCSVKAKTRSWRKVHKGENAKQCILDNSWLSLTGNVIMTQTHLPALVAGTSVWSHLFSITKGRHGALHGIILRVDWLQIKSLNKSLMTSVERFSLAWVSPKILLDWWNGFFIF